MTCHKMICHTCMLRELKLMTCNGLYKYKYIGYPARCCVVSYDLRKTNIIKKQHKKEGKQYDNVIHGHVL
jgi:hypothetical protein